MWEDTSTLGGDDSAKGHPASTPDRSFKDRGQRYRRSPNPSLSTTRARGTLNAHGESNFPETLSPVAPGPEVVSAAPTPRTDEDAMPECSDDGDGDSLEENWTGQGDDDWDEDVG